MSVGHHVAAVDALSLPIVACRGLWDKFAGPGSLGAVRRSYLRGVPSLVRCGAGGLSVDDVLALARDPEVNRRRQPLYLVSDGRPFVAVTDGSEMAALDIYAVDTGVPSDATRPIYRWLSATWTLTGCYVPVSAWRRGLTAEDVGGDQRELQIVLFESANAVDRVAGFARIVDDEDTAILASIRSIVGPRTQILRVSDLVELDLLTLCIREAT